MSDTNTFVDFLSVVNREFDSLGADSLPEFLSSTRNDFLTLIDTDVADMPECKDILDVANILVGSYFLAGFTMHIGLPGVDLRGDLDKFAVKRSPIKTALKFALGIGIAILGGRAILGRESYGVGTYGAPGDFGAILSLESFSDVDIDSIYEDVEERERKLDEQEAKLNEIRDSLKRKSEMERIRTERERLREDRERAKSGGKTNASASVGKQDLGRYISEAPNLATGKIFDLEVERNGNKVPIVFNIGLSVISADKPAMRNILGVSDYEYSFDNRKMLASAGAKSWLRDIILNRDLIDHMRKTRRADKTGFYKEIVKARTNNWFSSFFGNVSINNASSVIITTQEMMDEIEPIIGGPISDNNVRERLFKDTLTMLIFVVDRRWGMVTIYHRGLSRPSEVSFSDLKSTKGGGKMDVQEIIRAYQAGSNPIGR